MDPKRILFLGSVSENNLAKDDLAAIKKVMMHDQFFLELCPESTADVKLCDFENLIRDVRPDIIHITAMLNETKDALIVNGGALTKEMIASALHKASPSLIFLNVNGSKQLVSDINDGYHRLTIFTPISNVLVSEKHMTIATELFYNCMCYEHATIRGASEIAGISFSGYGENYHILPGKKSIDKEFYVDKN
jgi:hypothetical protein